MLLAAIAKLGLEITDKATDMTKMKHRKKFGDSFVHDTALAGTWGEEACRPLVDLLGLLNELQSATPAWLQEWRPLRTCAPAAS